MNRRVLSRATRHGILCGLICFVSCIHADECHVYQTPGMEASQQSAFYDVAVNGLESVVYMSVPPKGDGRQDGGAFDRADKRSFSFTSFSFSGEQFIWRAEQETLTPVKDRPWATSVKVFDNGKDYFVEGRTLCNAPHFVCNVPGTSGKLKNYLAC